MPMDVAVSRDSSRQQFPAVRLFEAAALALSPPSLFAATLAGLFLSGLEWLMGPALDPAPISDSFAEIWTAPLKAIPNEITGPLGMLLRPWLSVIQPVTAMLGTATGWTGWLTSSIQLGLAIGLWSVVGTFLCRRSAMLFAGNDESPVWSAIQYGGRRWVASAFAPLIPLFSVLLAGLIAVTFGMVGRFPLVGEWFLIIATPAIGLLGFAMAFLLFATALGWPLMIASVATDDCDSFGSLSRATSGLTSRPWHALGLTLLALVVGFVLLEVVSIVGMTTIWCGTASTAVGSGNERADALLLGPITYLVRSVVHGIGISFFWSAATVISLLLRQEVDGVPLHRLSLDDGLRPAREPLPVVGIPATDARFESNHDATSDATT